MEKNMLKFNEDLMKNCDDVSDKGYIFEVHIDFLKELHDLHFYPKEWKSINVRTCLYSLS